MVHQHFMLVDTMTVAENIVLGAEPGVAVAPIFRKRAPKFAVSPKNSVGCESGRSYRNLSVNGNSGSSY